MPFRGVQAAAFNVRENLAVVEGRRFEPGKNEIVVGRAAQQEFAGLDTGATIRFGQTNWEVVGVFEAGGSVSESELWTDVRVLQDVYRRGNSYQSVRVKLESADALESFRAALAADPRVDVDVMSERAYYSSQAEAMTKFIQFIGYPLTVLMALGALFGALNSMYSSVSTRGKEIATLRALGFRPFSVLVSTVIESILVALAGGALGALLIGLVGGLFPAIRAARLPVARALREL